MKLEHILFPTDFSEQCRHTAPFVRAFALRFDAGVLMLHVADVTPYMIAPPAEAPPVVFNPDEWRNEQRARLEQFLADELAGVRVVRVLVEGDPVHEIVNQARTQGIDLIMMPTHGRGRFSALLLGSVTAKVLHDAECPVWTTVHTQGQLPNVPDTLSRILCAVELTKEDSCTVRWARELAAAANACCLFVHAIPGSDLTPLETEEPARKAEIDEAQRKMLTLFGPEVTEREIAIEFGHPARVIHRVALAWQSDLVVLGRGKMRKPLGSIRTALNEIIRESPCPVISVQEQGAHRSPGGPGAPTS